MLDGLTLDQLRVLATVAVEGSFSGAGRRLRRVQSAVSTSMAKLEAELGVVVWDRSGKRPRLTEEGRAVLEAARRVLAEVDTLRRVASGIAGGLEATVSLCVDALFPLGALVTVCKRFAGTFPTVDLRVDIQLMSAVSERVATGAATVGVVSAAGIKPGLDRHALAPIRMVPVAAREHPLAALGGPISRERFADAIQIVLSERAVDATADQAVLSPRTWRVADLHTKHMMLRAGLGWGNLPEHLVKDDLDEGRLVALRPAAWSDDDELQLFAVHAAGAPLGPAHAWLVDALGEQCRVAARPERQRAENAQRLRAGRRRHA